MKTKIKNAPIRVKAGPDDGLEEGQFVAYASVFDVKDSYGDVVVRGAFKRTLDEWSSKDAPIPLLFGHRMDDPDFNIGHITEAVEDDHGLKVTGELDLESPKAAQTYRLLKGKRIEQLSYAYAVMDGGPAKKDGDDYFELRDLDLFEVSIVPVGANRETEVLAVKATAEAMIERAKNEGSLDAEFIDSLRSAQEAIGAVIKAASVDDQEKASGSTEAKSETSDEELEGAKSHVEDEEPKSSPSADFWATYINTREVELI